MVRRQNVLSLTLCLRKEMKPELTVILPLEEERAAFQDRKVGKRTFS